MSERSMPRAAMLAIGALLSAAACGEAAPPQTNQWIDVAHTGEGGQVQYLPSSVRKNADNTTDIVAKVAYPGWNTWTVETHDTVEQRTFSAERVTLRFDCGARAFAIVRREALDKNGYVKETIEPKAPSKTDFAPVQPGGLAAVVVARACPTA